MIRTHPFVESISTHNKNVKNSFRRMTICRYRYRAISPTSARDAVAATATAHQITINMNRKMLIHISFCMVPFAFDKNRN